LVSSGQVFELGFTSANKSRYLGILYKKMPGILLWIKNQNNLLTDPSGVSNNQTLILLNQRNLTIWHLDSPRAAQTLVAQLLGVISNQSFLSS